MTVIKVSQSHLEVVLRCSELRGWCIQGETRWSQPQCSQRALNVEGATERVRQESDISERTRLRQKVEMTHFQACFFLKTLFLDEEVDAWKRITSPSCDTSVCLLTSLSAWLFWPLYSFYELSGAITVVHKDPKC